MTVSSIKVKVIRRPIVKLKVLPRFPANAVGANFIVITRANGTYTFDVDYTVLPPGPISDPTTAMVAVQDLTAGVYKYVALSSLLVSGLDADLQAIAALTGAGILRRTGTNTWTLGTTVATTEGGTGLTGYAQGDMLYGSATDTLAKLAKNTTATRYIANTGTTNNPAWDQIDLTNGVKNILPGASGGTNNGFMQFSGPATALKTFTLPNATATILTDANTVTAPQGGTGQSSYAIGDLLYASASNALSKLADVATGNAMISGGVGVAPLYGKIGLTTHVSGTLPVANGGTNSASASGTALDNITGFASTGFLTRTGAGTYAFQSTTNGITNANLAQAAAYTIKGNATGSTANVTDISIPALTLKASPVSGDIVLLVDSAASNALKYTTVSALSSAGSVASLNTETGAVVLLPEPQGRLSLVTGDPVPRADQTAKTTIYLTAKNGVRVPVYDGTNARILTFLSDLSCALDGNSADTQYVSGGNTYDMFVAVVSGTTYFGHSPVWTNDTTRASALSRSSAHGLLVNTSSMSLRFGSATGNLVTVPAGQATWLGTFRATANGQTEDSAVKRFLANAYNPVPRDMYSTVTSNLATIDTTFTARAAALRLDWISIAANGAAQITQNLIVSNTGAGSRVESYLRSDGSVIEESMGAGTSANSSDICSFANGIAKTFADGIHYIESLQHNNGGTGTIYGNTVGGANLRSTIKGTVMS